jgi:hypothetical protein
MPATFADHARAGTDNWRYMTEQLRAMWDAELMRLVKAEATQNGGGSRGVDEKPAAKSAKKKGA